MPIGMTFNKSSLTIMPVWMLFPSNLIPLGKPETHVANLTAQVLSTGRLAQWQGA